MNLLAVIDDRHGVTRAKQQRPVTAREQLAARISARARGAHS